MTVVYETLQLWHTGYLKSFAVCCIKYMTLLQHEFQSIVIYDLFMRQVLFLDPYKYINKCMLLLFFLVYAK